MSFKGSPTSRLKNKWNPKWCYIIDPSLWQENFHKEIVFSLISKKNVALVRYMVATVGLHY